MGMQFNNNALNVEENNSLAKFVNVYELDYWPRNLLENYLFVATNILMKVSMYIVA